MLHSHVAAGIFLQNATMSTLNYLIRLFVLAETKIYPNIYTVNRSLRAAGSHPLAGQPKATDAGSTTVARPSLNRWEIRYGDRCYLHLMLVN